MNIGARETTPLEWPTRLRLTQSVDVKGVVPCGSPEVVSFMLLINIRTGSRINEYGLPIHGKVKAQGICMAVSVAASFSRTSIDHELLGLRRC
jgi:hypothetical protein